MSTEAKKQSAFTVAPMMEFQWYWSFVLLPLPWLVRMAMPANAVSQEAALRVPSLQDFSGLVSTMRSKQRPFALWLALLGWVFFVIAAARPQWLGEPIELPVSGRDLMLAVDLSGSMGTEDFVINDKTVDRLTATKAVASEFIERRIGDRLGLILFGRQAYLQTPLTFDRQTVKTLLLEAVIGLAGKETAIGDAIGLSIKRLSESREKSDEAQQTVLVLLTDGANTAGEVEPVKAAEVAAEQGLRIYTIGIGADEVLIQSFFGMRKVNPSADLDEATLRAIAEKTGGRYFRARDTVELSNIYTLLDELEPVESDKQSFRPRQALYYWPLSIAAVLALLVLLLQFRRA